MKNMRQITKILFCVLSISLVFTSCENKMDEHYEVPEGWPTSVWEELTDRGNFSIFLKGAELSGFKPLLEGRSVLTVMAPDDAAFSAYLSEKAYSDISEMNQEELKKLIGFHLIYYSYTKDKLVHFSPLGDLATEEDRESSAGLYYKFRTWSSNAPSVEQDASGKSFTIYHLDRFIPVFSHLFFSSREIDAKSNYEYFYPNSSWTGGDGFNVSNASVQEYELKANNGYFYAINKVLEPLETVYTELKNRPEYSVFFNLYNKYTMYAYDETLTKDYGANLGVDSLYLHLHTNLPSIAMEWPVSSYQHVTSLSAVGFSVFAPSNTAMNTFFNAFWKVGGYNSLDEIDPLLMSHFLGQYYVAGSLVFPEQIVKGTVKNKYGVVFDYFDPATVKDKTICVNGSFYGLDDLKTPPLFEAVVGPAFQYPDYLSYLYALDGSSLLNSYVSSDTEYIMLIPDNEQMKGSGYELKTNDLGTFLQEEGEDGWANVSSNTKQNIVNTHTVNGQGELKTTGTHVYPVQAPFSYLYVKDGKIASNALFNKLLEPDFVSGGGQAFVPFREITYQGGAWSNGKAYSYQYPEVFLPEASDGLAHALAVCNDSRYPYNSFVQLMKKAELINGTTIPMLAGSRFVAFIPTNEAIASAIANNEVGGITDGTMNADGTVNVSDANFRQEELREYLLSHFLRNREVTISTYPYPGSVFKTGTYVSASYRTLKYIDNGSSLSLEFEGNANPFRVIPRYDYFPFAYKDGCMHLIEKAF